VVKGGQEWSSGQEWSRMVKGDQGWLRVVKGR
jgi:hypothetical protein